MPVLYYIHLLVLIQRIEGFTLSTSSERLTVGTAFTFTCHPNTVPLVLVFRSDNHHECQITTISDGSCEVDNNPEFVCTCNHATKNYTLTIPGSYYNDSYHNSIWKCRDLAGGGQSNNITLFINDPISSVNISPTSEDVPVGSTRSLTCITNPGRPTARIQWYISNETAERNLTSLASQSPNCYPGCDQKTASNSTLVYTGFRNDDQYNIFCIASNTEGRTVRSRNSTINILYGPDEVNITPTYIPYIVIEGGRLGPINCSADCKPDCTRTWIGANLPNGSRSVLYLQNINRNQTGRYQCNASNAFGTSMSTVIDVRVQYEPTIKNITDQIVDEGGNIVLKAKITANPNATLVWWTRESDTTFLQNSTDLAIINISRNQNGTYVIHATNTMTPSGQTELVRTVVEKIVITVNYGPNAVVLTPSDPFYTVTETTGSIGPIFCTAECRPNCTMSWSGPNLPGGTTSVLSLQDIKRSQAGAYECNANNSVGFLASGIITLIVKYVPSILSISGKIAYNETENGFLQCNVEGIPEPYIQWLLMGSVQTQTRVVSNRSILVFNHLNCLDMGLYRCVTKNSIGSDKSEVNVTVRCTPRLDTLEHDILDTVFVKENESFNITVHIIAYPKPSLYWKFTQNQHFTTITKRVTNTYYVSRHTSSLYIYNMTEQNFGKYIIYGRYGINNSNYEIGSFHVKEARNPDAPDYLVATCKYDLLIISWRSGYNGGDNQTFNVVLTNSETGDVSVSDSLEDPGFGRSVHFNTDSLAEDSKYNIYVRSTNQFGTSRTKTDVTCTTTGYSAKNEKWTSYPAGIGTGIGIAVSVFVLVLGIRTLIRFGRKNTPDTTNMYDETESRDRQPNAYNELNEIQRDKIQDKNTSRNTAYEDVKAYDDVAERIC